MQTKTKATIMIRYLLLLLPSIALAEMILPIVEVYDGDTIKTQFTLPGDLRNISVRVQGIDTPENPAKSYATTGKLGRAKCHKEAEMALQAKKFVQTLAEPNSHMTVTNYKWGKYGGRFVGNVTIDGFDVAQMLIENGLAVPYDGGTKTKDWCR